MDEIGFFYIFIFFLATALINHSQQDWLWQNNCFKCANTDPKRNDVILDTFSGIECISNAMGQYFASSFWWKENRQIYPMQKSTRNVSILYRSIWQALRIAKEHFITSSDSDYQHGCACSNFAICQCSNFTEVLLPTYLCILTTSFLYWTFGESQDIWKLTESYRRL